MNFSALKDVGFWNDVWNALFMDETQYEHIGNGGGSLISWKLMIIGIAIGLALAMFGAVFNKRVLGDFVRCVLREDALSPETAKTLSELGFVRSTAIRQSLRSGVTLRRVVRCREEEEFYAEQTRLREEYEEKRQADPKLPKFKELTYRVNVDEDHFYIPEELKYMADVKFEKQGSGLPVAIFFSVVLIAVAALLIKVFPYFLSFADSWLGSVYDVFSYQDNMIP